MFDEIPEPEELLPVDEQQAIRFDANPVRRLVELIFREALAAHASDIMLLRLDTRLSVLFQIGTEWRERDTLPEWLWHLILGRLHRMLAIERYRERQKVNSLRFASLAAGTAEFQIAFAADRVMLTISGPSI